MIVQPAVVVVEPRLGAVAFYFEQVRVAITVAMYAMPSMPPLSVKAFDDLLS